MFGRQNQYPVHLECVITGDASAGIAFKVFRAGTTVDVTSTILGTFNGIAITDVEVVTETGGDVVIVADTDADGRRIAGGNVAANGGLARSLRTPYYCPAGVIPRLIGPSSGETRATLSGFLYRA